MEWGVCPWRRRSALSKSCPGGVFGAFRPTTSGGEIYAMAIDEVLVDEHSKYQHVQMLNSKTYGNVLVLDGCIQLTEYDEFSYQEMMV
jgi:spermidine synthase